MYAIYGNIYHKYTPPILAYIPCMDPMGMQTCFLRNMAIFLKSQMKSDRTCGLFEYLNILNGNCAW